jgi:thiamine biosynthesis lipoprotein
MNAERVHRFSHDAMACTWGIYVVGLDAAYAAQAARAAFDEIDRLDLELSRFIEHSDIARINALAAGQWVQVGIDAIECLEAARQVHSDTNGAFDVTAGSFRTPDCGLRIADCGLLRPPSSVLSAAAPTTGPHLLRIDRTHRVVTVLADSVIVDLGAIGKGYAVAQAVAVLRDWSIGAGMVHSGQSTVYAFGSPPGESGWTVPIRNPLDPFNSIGEVLLRDRALSGSGALIHGQHILDPRTGKPASGPPGAWAVCPSAPLSDAISTAFMVMSVAEVEEYCSRHPETTALLWLERTPGSFELVRFGAEVESRTTNSES